MDVNLTKYITETERVLCNACGADDYEPFCGQERFGLPLQSVICRQCGLMYLNPRPTKKMYAELNESDYRKAASGTDEGIDAEFIVRRNFSAAKLIPFWQKFSEHKNLRSLLDIGSSYGGIAAAFADVYPKLGLYGVEPVLRHVEYSRQKVAGMHVTPGLFEDFATDQEFDVIVCVQTLNHTLDPLNNLRKMKSLLTKQGSILLVVQDAISILLNRPLSKMPEIWHPYMFCAENISFLLHQAGLSIIGQQLNTLDAQALTQKDIKNMTFPRMFILARPNGQPNPVINKPDYKIILGRLRRNAFFYDQWQDEINSWCWPRGWRRIYRGLLQLSRQ